MIRLPPIDATGEPTTWVVQRLEFWDGARRVWVAQRQAPRIGTLAVSRWKVSDLDRWDPYAAWPDLMLRGGYRARLLVWSGRWEEWRNVEARSGYDPGQLYYS